MTFLLVSGRGGEGECFFFFRELQIFFYCLGRVLSAESEEMKLQSFFFPCLFFLGRCVYLLNGNNKTGFFYCFRPCFKC